VASAISLANTGSTIPFGVTSANVAILIGGGSWLPNYIRPRRCAF
jgi:hypothetical protein